MGSRNENGFVCLAKTTKIPTISSGVFGSELLRRSRLLGYGRVRRGNAFHHVLRIVLEELSRGTRQELLLFRQQLRLVRIREKKVRAFHAAVLDQHDEIVRGHRGMPELRIF